MTRKFLFCFPLRVGSIVFGYTIIRYDFNLMKSVQYLCNEHLSPAAFALNACWLFLFEIISVAVIIYNMYMLGLCILSEDKYETEQKFRNWEMVEQLFAQEKDSLVITITLLYHMCYIFIGVLLIIFTSLFLCGIARANRCLVSTFFVYCFIHMFLTLCLIVWEATSKGYVQLGLIIVSDVLLMLCLFSVKYLMESISSGYMYCEPGDIRY